MQHRKCVGIWIRVSTEDQARGDSPEHHEKRARLYAEAHGWEVTTVYHLEAMSGKSVMGYPETKRMLEDIRKGTISGLIFSKLARLARNTKELLEFSEIFKNENADLISLQESIDTSSPAGRMFYTMIAAMAQWEREEIAERVAASVPIRAKLGKPVSGVPSLGYKWENKQLVIDEQFAPVRKLVYELFLKYKRKRTVAGKLNEMGYRSKRGGKFTDMSILHLLRDPMAKGERRANYTTRRGGKKEEKPVSEWIITPCPAIVDKETWDECNRILDESLETHRKRGPRPKHLLAGFVDCAKCGKRMYVFHQTNCPVYRCQKCKTRIPAQDLEDIFRDQLKKFLLTETTITEFLEKIDATIEEKSKLLSIVSEEKIATKEKMDRIVDLRINGEMTKDAFAQHYKPLEERFNQLSDQLPEIEAEIDFLKIQHRSSGVILQDARDLYNNWDTMTFENKRIIVEAITDSITIDTEDIQIELSYLPMHFSPANLNSGKKHDNVVNAVTYGDYKIYRRAPTE